MGSPARRPHAQSNNFFLLNGFFFLVLALAALGRRDLTQRPTNYRAQDKEGYEVDRKDDQHSEAVVPQHRREGDY